MNERVKKLRQQSVTIKPYISTERAELITDFYKQNLHLKTSMPVSTKRLDEQLAKLK